LPVQRFLPSLPRVIGFLRIIGILNAALWFGGSIFLTFFVGPAFFSEPMVELLTKPYAGAAAQIVLERYFTLQIVCGLVAFAHLVAESLYLSRPIFRWSLSLVAAIFVLALVGGYGIQPKLKQLHLQMYSPETTDEIKAASRKSFGLWHGISWIANIAALGGITVYLFRITRQGDNSRYRW
jgi:hypothetical protein